MLALPWLMAIGIITGLVARNIVGGKAFGPVADALLGNRNGSIHKGLFNASCLRGRLTLVRGPHFFHK